MIKDTLKNSIRSLSKRYDIEPTQLRIRISKPDGNLEYDIMKNADILQNTNIATALNLNSVVAYMVGNKIDAIFRTIAMQSNLPEKTLNVRIYTSDGSCEPSLYLFDGTSPIKKLDLDDYV